jgi:hypothetical protein
VNAPGLKKQKTDTHWRSKKGKGNFNWRMKYPISIPGKNWPRLQIAAWDRDLLSSNDAIGEITYPLTALCKKALKNPGKRVKVVRKQRGEGFAKLKKTLSDRFFLPDLLLPPETKSQVRAVAFCFPRCPVCT